MTYAAPKITGVAATAVMAETPRPMTTASGSFPRAPLVLIDVETDQGVVGRAYIFVYSPAALKPAVAVFAELNEILKGRPAAPVDISREMEARFRLMGKQGVFGMALGGLDMCLWDIVAKSREMTVAELLGASNAPQLAYDSYGLFDEAWGEAELAKSLQKGFDAVKFKTGAGDLARDIDDLTRIREIVGPDVKLMIDYNQSLTAPEAATRVARLEERFDLYWLEEPVRAEDLAGHAAVRERVATPVQTGENWWFPEDAARALAAGACDMAMPDLMKIGGITGWLNVAGQCAGASVPVSSHLFPEASAHALAAIPNAHYLEVMDAAAKVLQEPVEVIGGRIAPRGPGLGMEWDMDAVRAFSA